MVSIHVYVDPDMLDLSACAYFQKFCKGPGHDPDGICSFGCREEPACLVDRPHGGWPAERRVLDSGMIILEISG